jgi:WD40 repeat protein
MNISKAVPEAGFLLVLGLVFGALIPFEPRWFNVTMASASHESEEAEVDYVAVADIQWTPDGDRLLTRSNGGPFGPGAFSFCDLAPGAAARPRWSGIRETSHAVLSSGGSTAFFSTYQGNVLCVQVNSTENQTAKVQTLIELPAGERICALAAAPDGRLLALASLQGTILLRDSEGVVSGPLFRDGHGGIACLAFSADGRRLASIGPFRSIGVWDVRQQLQLQEFTGHGGLASEAVFLDGGRHVLSCGLDGTLRQWDVASGSEVWCGRLPGDSQIFSLTVDRHEKLAVTAHDDGRIAFWDLIDAELLDDFPAHAGLVSRVRFSPDGTLLASGGLDGMIRIWDVANRSVKTEINMRHAQ